jgi:hypothetical protein
VFLLDMGYSATFALLCIYLLPEPARHIAALSLLFVSADSIKPEMAELVSQVVENDPCVKALVKGVTKKDEKR